MKYLYWKGNLHVTSKNGVCTSKFACTHTFRQLFKAIAMDRGTLDDQTIN